MNLFFRVDDTRTELLPELVELAGDEESSVRLAAFDSIVSLMEMMDSGESLLDETSVSVSTASKTIPLLQMTASMSWFPW